MPYFDRIEIQYEHIHSHSHCHVIPSFGFIAIQLIYFSSEEEKHFCHSIVSPSRLFDSHEVLLRLHFNSAEVDPFVECANFTCTYYFYFALFFFVIIISSFWLLFHGWKSHGNSYVHTHTRAQHSHTRDVCVLCCAVRCAIKPNGFFHVYGFFIRRRRCLRRRWTEH